MTQYKSLKTLGIPYEIEFSNILTNGLMRIAECRPFFTGSLSRPLKVGLLRNAKVRANQSPRRAVDFSAEGLIFMFIRLARLEVGLMMSIIDYVAFINTMRLSMVVRSVMR